MEQNLCCSGKLDPLGNPRSSAPKAESKSRALDITEPTMDPLTLLAEKVIEMMQNQIITMQKITSLEKKRPQPHYPPQFPQNPYPPKKNQR